MRRSLFRGRPFGPADRSEPPVQRFGGLIRQIVTIEAAVLSIEGLLELDETFARLLGDRGWAVGQRFGLGDIAIGTVLGY